MCPGKALALLELKIMLIYILSTIDWTIKKEDLKNDDMWITLMSPHELHLKVEKKLI